MNYLDLLKTIYTKEKVVKLDDLGLCIAVTHTLAKEASNLPALKKVVPFLFYIPPEHYFYLLYFNIPRKNYVPKSLKIEKEEIKKDKFYDSFKRYFDFSEREMYLNQELLQELREDKNFKKELLS